MFVFPAGGAIPAVVRAGVVAAGASDIVVSAAGTGVVVADVLEIAAGGAVPDEGFGVVLEREERPDADVNWPICGPKNIAAGITFHVLKRGSLSRGGTVTLPEDED